MAAELQFALSVRVKPAADASARDWLDVTATTFTGTEVYAQDERALAQSTAQTFDLSNLKARRFALVIGTPTAGANPKFTVEAGWSDGTFTKMAAPDVTATAPFIALLSGLRPSGDSAALIITAIRITRNDAGTDKPFVRLAALCD